MADEIPQIQDSQPIFSPVPIESEAKGSESMAEALGNLSDKSATVAENAGNAQSKAMFTSAVANSQQLRTAAAERFLENPDQSEKIAKGYTDALDVVKTSAFVNSADRSRLNRYVGAMQNQINLKATETSVRQNQRMTAVTHFANWPDQLKAYQEALTSGDTKTAEQLHDAMTTNLRSLVSIGSLTPEMAGSGFKDMASVVAVAADHHALYGNPDATASDYHAAAANPLAPTGSNPNSPINQSTDWMINYYNGDKTFRGVLSDISNRQLPNPQTFDSLQPAQRARAIMSMQGVQVADGMINSGAPYAEIVDKYKELNQKGRVLSYKDMSTRDALESYVNNLKSGNYLDIMKQTPTGNGIMENFVQQNAAIQNSPIDANKKNQLLLQNKNSMVDAAVSYGNAHHIPQQFIQPIPKSDIANVQNAFTLGADPAIVLNTLGTYTKQNQNFVANAMKDPNQQLIIQGIAWAPPSVSPQEKLDFIAANQKGRGLTNKESPLKESGQVKDSDLTLRIYSNLKPAMQILSQNYDFAKAQVLQQAMLSTTLKYTKYLAQKDNNPMMEENKANFILSSARWKDYVDQASKIYSQSFQQISGSNYSVNPQQLSMPVTKQELDILAQYSTDKGYDYLKGKGSAAEFETASSRNPLRMVITPTNYVQAIDNDGNVFYSTPLTHDLISHAEKENHDRLIQKERDFQGVLQRHFLGGRAPGVTQNANAQ